MKFLLISYGLRMAGLPRWASRALARLLLIGAVLTSASALLAGEVSGRVVGVSDGDTITVLTANKQSLRVRLKGIDAPESHQAFGSAAKRTLSDLVYGRTVAVRYDAQDRYGRILGVVYLGNEDVNFAMVRAGMAWHGTTSSTLATNPLESDSATPWLKKALRPPAAGSGAMPAPRRPGTSDRPSVEALHGMPARQTA